MYICIYVNIYTQQLMNKEGMNLKENKEGYTMGVREGKEKWELM